jgi:hypothetical protein
VTLAIDAVRYQSAPRFPDYLAAVTKHAEIWNALYRTASVQPEAVDRLKQVASGLRVLVLSEDWCSDCFSCVPVVARLTEHAGMELRVLGRDANPDIMASYLSTRTESIPVAMVLDDAFHVLAWWGPRPSPLQRWYRSEAMWLAKEERGRRKRAWYARDRGRTVVDEVIDTVERGRRRSSDKPSVN